MTEDKKPVVKQHIIEKRVYEAMLKRLTVVLGDPTSLEPDAFLAEWSRCLKAYSSEELSEAADTIMRTHKGPARWPKLAEAIEQCEAARERHQYRVTKKSPEMGYRQRIRRAEEMMLCDLGVQAAHEHWALGLRDFIFEKNRLPRDHEIERIRETSEFIARCAAGAVDMGTMHDALVGVAKIFVDKREGLAQRVFSGVRYAR